MAEPAIGSTLGGYRVDALIARGGMGVVYRATHLALDRPVALKVIARHLADDEAFRERFLRESRLAARLDHPNVVPVYDAREEDGELIVAMRLVEGGDLKRRIAADGPAAAAPKRSSCSARSRGRSTPPTPPASSTATSSPTTSCSRATAPSSPTSASPRRSATPACSSGASIAGTVEYMSPEQWQGRSVGPAADVYSLGCVLYEALTGIVPYARQAADTEPEIPEGLDEVIERAVAKDPDRRYPTAGGLIDAAREREGATPAATRVLSDTPGRPTAVIAAAGADAAASASAAARRRPWVAIGDPRRALRRSRPGRSSCSAATGSRSPTPIAIGQGPLRLATGERSVWVTSARDGTLTRIDSASGLVSGRPLRLEPRHLRASPSAPARSGSRARAPARSCASTATRGRIEDEIPVGGRPGADRLRRRPGLGRRRGRRRRHRDQRPRRQGLQARHRPPRRRRCASRSAPAASG